MRANHDALITRLNIVSIPSLRPNYFISTSEACSNTKTNRIHSSDTLTVLHTSTYRNRISLTRTSKSINSNPRLLMKKTIIPQKTQNKLKYLQNFYIEDCVQVLKLTPSKTCKKSSQSLLSRIKLRKTNTRTSMNTSSMQTANIETQEDL